MNTTRPDRADAHFHSRYEQRVAWFTALWAAMSLLAVASELLTWL